MEIVKFNIIEYIETTNEKIAIYAENEKNSRKLWNLLKNSVTPYEDLAWDINDFEAYSFSGNVAYHCSYSYYKDRGYTLYRYKDMKNKFKESLY